MGSITYSAISLLLCIGVNFAFEFSVSQMIKMRLAKVPSVVLGTLGSSITWSRRSVESGSEVGTPAVQDLGFWVWSSGLSLATPATSMRQREIKTRMFHDSHAHIHIWRQPGASKWSWWASLSSLVCLRVFLAGLLSPLCAFSLSASTSSISSAAPLSISSSLRFRFVIGAPSSLSLMDTVVDEP